MREINGETEERKEKGREGKREERKKGNMA